MLAQSEFTLLKWSKVYMHVSIQTVSLWLRLILFLNPFLNVNSLDFVLSLATTAAWEQCFTNSRFNWITSSSMASETPLYPSATETSNFGQFSCSAKVVPSLSLTFLTDNRSHLFAITTAGISWPLCLTSMSFRVHAYS